MQFEWGSLLEMSFAKPRRWKDNIKWDLKETDCEGGRWMYLAKDYVQCCALILAVLNLQILLPKKTCQLVSWCLPHMFRGKIAMESLVYNSVCQFVVWLLALLGLDTFIRDTWKLVFGINWNELLYFSSYSFQKNGILSVTSYSCDITCCNMGVTYPITTHISSWTMEDQDDSGMQSIQLIQYSMCVYSAWQ